MFGQSHTRAAATSTAICNLVLQFNGVLRGSVQNLSIKSIVLKLQAVNTRGQAFKGYHEGIPSDYHFPYNQRQET